MNPCNGCRIFHTSIKITAMMALEKVGLPDFGESFKVTRINPGTPVSNALFHLSYLKDKRRTSNFKKLQT